jgi:hypothetical protein
MISAVRLGAGSRLRSLVSFKRARSKARLGNVNRPPLKMIIWDWKFFLLIMALAMNFRYADMLEKAARDRIPNVPLWMMTTGGQIWLLLLSVALVIGGLVSVIIQFFREPWYTVIIGAVSASVAAGILGALLWSFGFGRILWLLSYPLILIAAFLVYGG